MNQGRQAWIRLVVAMLTTVAAVLTAAPTIARGVAPLWLGAAVGVCVAALAVGVALSEGARSEDAQAETTLAEHLSRERRSELDAETQRALDMALDELRERASEPIRARELPSQAGTVQRVPDKTVKPPPGRRWSGVVSRATAGAAALTLAIVTGLGAAIAGDIASATHIAQQVSSDVQGETCTEVVEQVSDLARQDPQVAARYARGEAGLPRLVESAVQKRCGGSFTALLRSGPRTADAGRGTEGRATRRR